MLEAIRRKFNEGWYAARYKTFLKDFDGTPFDYYMAQGWRLGHDPHADFSELFYRAEYDDVAQALQDGAYSSGFHHYLQHGIAEGRLAVPKAPLGRQFYEQAYFHIDCAYLEAQHRIDPARYLSTYDFYFIESRRTDIDPNPLFSERGYLYFHPDVVEARKNRDPIVGCGFAHFLTTGLAEGRRICSVSEFARLAAQIGALSGRLPYFLIQDDESEFHGAGSLRSFIRSAWDIPHIGIYNSAILVAHFRAMRPQQFGEGYRWCSFENEIKPLTDSQAEFIARHAHKRRRTIVIYARPEAHAARNEFAIIMLSLHKLIEDGELDRDK